MAAEVRVFVDTADNINRALAYRCDMLVEEIQRMAKNAEREGNLPLAEELRTKWQTIDSFAGHVFCWLDELNRKGKTTALQVLTDGWLRNTVNPGDECSDDPYDVRRDVRVLCGSECASYEDEDEEEYDDELAAD